MTRSALALALALALPAGATPPPDSPERVIADARAELEALDNLVDDAGSRAVQKEIHRKVDRIDALLRRLDAMQGSADVAIAVPGAAVGTRAGPGGVVVAIDATGFQDPGLQPTAEPPVAEPIATDPASFDRILSSVQRESFSDQKLAILRSAAMDHRFTSAQAARLMDAFDFGQDQVEAGAILYPAVVDPENWYQVYEVFDFSSDADALRRRVGR